MEVLASNGLTFSLSLYLTISEDQTKEICREFINKYKDGSLKWMSANKSYRVFKELPSAHLYNIHKKSINSRKVLIDAYLDDIPSYKRFRAHKNLLLVFSTISYLTAKELKSRKADIWENRNPEDILVLPTEYQLQ